PDAAVESGWKPRHNRTRKDKSPAVSRSYCRALRPGGHLGLAAFVIAHRRLTGVVPENLIRPDSRGEAESAHHHI
ncbi:MAG: hypothetical protein WAU59_19915, partial [Rhodoplanes sp.]